MPASRTNDPPLMVLMYIPTPNRLDFVDLLFVLDLLDLAFVFMYGFSFLCFLSLIDFCDLGEEDGSP